MRWHNGHAGQGIAVAALLVLACKTVADEPPAAAPINPVVYKNIYESKRKSAEVVARVRVLAAVCTEVVGETPVNRSGTLKLSLQVLAVEKGPVQKNDILIVTHTVRLPGGPGPRSYPYQVAVRQFPFTPGVQGDAALRWDNERRTYVAVTGWVAEPNGAAIPTEVGKAFVAGDSPPKK
jgi:hypothetical protein